MLRGARIDLQTARSAIDDDLKTVYARDVSARHLSDDAIRAVSTIVRALEGAMGKTADGVGARFAEDPKHPGRRVRPYFPLTSDPAQFGELFNKELPGVAASRPDIRDAFERHQPYQPGKDILRHLKQLYREHHHQDFTLQERQDSGFVGWQLGPFSFGSQSVNASPSGWKGVLIHEEVVPTEEVPGAAMTMRNWADWLFADLEISVALTVERLYRRCSEACTDISRVSELSS